MPSWTLLVRARRPSVRRARAWSVLAGWLIVGSLVLAPLVARANEVIEATQVRLEPSADAEALVLSADFTVPLSNRLEEAINDGVPLHFVAEFEMRRPRWYMWDEKVVQTSQSWRLSYHALTRQYRLNLNGFVQQFPTLTGAMRAMTQVRGWRVAQPADLRPGIAYDAQVRMRLDMSQLPKPYQVTAITNREWTLQAEWKRFTFTPEIPKSVP